jgi:hypothetical protein
MNEADWPLLTVAFKSHTLHGILGVREVGIREVGRNALTVFTNF